MKKAMVLVLVLVCVVCLAAVSQAAEEKKVMKPATPAKAMPAQPPQMLYRPSMMMVSGTVTRINNADPKNVTLEVKNDSDGKTQTVAIMPWTRVVKNTDITELKSGDKVQIAARKTEDNKDAALSVMFGKIEPPPMMPRAMVPAKAAAQPAPRK